MDLELKEELDAFVNASLEEYAKLFLEPGAEVKQASSAVLQQLQNNHRTFANGSIACIAELSACAHAIRSKDTLSTTRARSFGVGPD